MATATAPQEVCRVGGRSNTGRSSSSACRHLWFTTHALLTWPYRHLRTDQAVLDDVGSLCGTETLTLSRNLNVLVALRQATTCDTATYTRVEVRVT